MHNHTLFRLPRRRPDQHEFAARIRRHRLNTRNPQPLLKRVFIPAQPFVGAVDDMIRRPFIVDEH